MPKKFLPFYLVRCTVIILTFFNVLFNISIDLIQLWKVFQTMSSIHSVIAPFLVFAVQPLILATQVGFLLQRHTLLQFFEDWKKLEDQTNFNQITANNGQFLKIILMIINIGYSCVAFCLFLHFALLLFDVFSFEHYMLNSSIVAHVRGLSSLGIPVKLYLTCRTLEALPISNSIMISDMVPSVVYKHAAIHLRALESKLGTILNERLTERSAGVWQNKVTAVGLYGDGPVTDSNSKLTADYLNHLLIHYDTIRSLVIRADNIFGPHIIFNHGLHFFTICTLVYTLLHDLKGNAHSMADIYFCLPFLFVFLVRFFVCVLLMSSVHQSIVQLRSTLAYAQTQIDQWLNEHERRILDNFVNRLANDKLAASPLGLYTINHSIFLKMLSLTVSYTIVLLQID